MYKSQFLVRYGAAVIVLLGLLVTGCESGQSDAEKAAIESGRENVDAMAKEHADDTTEASPAVSSEPAKPVISQSMPYTEHRDQLVYGYFSAPADMFEPLPAVIMIHEWWGLNDNIRAMADRLAGEGYIVFAVDLFAGKVASTPGEARALMMDAVENPEAVDENIRAAFNFVSTTAGAPRVGSLGWCFGGGLSLKMAQLFPEQLDASVIYYGQTTSDDALLEPVQSPILGLFGADDTGIKVASVESFREALQRLDKNHEVHIYPGVGHAFANPTGRNYNASAAEDAWRRTLKFLELHLAINTTS